MHKLKVEQAANGPGPTCRDEGHGSGRGPAGPEECLVIPPSPRLTPGHLVWGKILNHLKCSQEETNHRSPVCSLDIRPGLSALPVPSWFPSTRLPRLYMGWGQRTTPSALPAQLKMSLPSVRKRDSLGSNPSWGTFSLCNLRQLT